MRLLAVRYSTNPDVERFYATLGFALDETVSCDSWKQMNADSGSIDIHLPHSNSPAWDVSMESTVPLEKVLDMLAAAQFDAGEIGVDSAVRYLPVQDPDGIAVRINELV